jgi:MoaA/NifB/PqqE/SkfB family radical SAM enzyme
LLLRPGRPVPLFSSLEVTRRCNRRCRYCASPTADASADLPTADWLGILADLARSGCAATSFTGGEPLLRDDLETLAAAARDHGLRVGLNTNGGLLGRRRGLLPLLDSVTLSLDGIREVNDTLRGPGAFDEVLEALAVLRGAGVPARITAVLSSASLPDLKVFLEQVACLDVPVLFQPAYDDLLRAPGRPDPERPDPAALADAIDLLLAAKARGLRVANSTAALRRMRGDLGVPMPPCRGGRLFVRITHRGTLEVCGIRGDPSPAGIDARDGIVAGMGRIAAAPGRCGHCGSAARLEFNLLAAGRPDVLWERLVARRN